jgi:hypothetical protein
MQLTRLSGHLPARFICAGQVGREAATGGTFRFVHCPLLYANTVYTGYSVLAAAVSDAQRAGQQQLSGNMHGRQNHLTWAPSCVLCALSAARTLSPAADLPPPRPAAGCRSSRCAGPNARPRMAAAEKARCAALGTWNLTRAGPAGSATAAAVCSPTGSRAPASARSSAISAAACSCVLAPAAHD